MNANGFSRELLEPQPLCREADAAKLGEWEPSTTYMYIPSPGTVIQYAQISENKFNKHEIRG